MERLTKGVGAVSSVRQKCLAYLLCEVGLRAAQKTQDLQLSCRLRLQLMDMLKDFMFEKVVCVCVCLVYIPVSCRSFLTFDVIHIQIINCSFLPWCFVV